MDAAVLDREVAEIKRVGQLMESQRRTYDALAASRRQRMLLLAIESGISQSELAERLGVSPAVVQHSLREARKQPVRRLSFAEPKVQGRWARELRLRKDLTRKQIAEQVGVPESWVRDVENGIVTSHQGALPILFDKLGVTVDRFAVEGPL